MNAQSRLSANHGRYSLADFQHQCANIAVRTALTSEEKLGYLNADLCLMSTPSKSGIAGAKTLWDELQYAHIIQVPYVHFVVSEKWVTHTWLLY